MGGQYFGTLRMEVLCDLPPPLRGQYFGRCQTQLCTIRMEVLCDLPPPLELVTLPPPPPSQQEQRDIAT
jgi:hypothetical protein